MNMEGKLCKGCHRRKPRTEFPKSRTKDGRAGTCTECKDAKMAEYRRRREERDARWRDQERSYVDRLVNRRPRGTVLS